METLTQIHDFFYGQMGVAFYYMLGFIGVIAALAQFRLYEKASQPGIAALVPFWNLVVFLRIAGRPAKQAWLFLIPIYGQLYFMPKVWIEVVQSFGKRTILDYVLAIFLNALYVLNLALDQNTEYQGPVYGTQKAPPAPRSLKKTATAAPLAA